ERRRARLAAEARELRLAEELRDRRGDLTVGAMDEVRESLRAPLLGHLLELRDLGTAELARHLQEADRGRVREDAELRAARELGRVLDLEAEPQVGLVGAVPAVGLLPRQAREGRR